MSTSPATEHTAVLIEARRGEVEIALASLPLPNEPALLYDPVRYVLSGGGKRLRPVLLLLTAESFGVSAQKAMPAALAVEVFHNFTLVHDDIMDRAEERRGKKTVHIKWDVGTALLSGDYMVALSYDLLTRLDTPHLPAIMDSYHQMVRLLCEGQALDKSFELHRDVSVDEYLQMIDCKTGALIAAVFQIGGWLGGAEEADIKSLNLLGKLVGRAFQIQDDLLDLTAEDPGWGKKIGGDLIEGKKAYLLLRSLETISGPDRSLFVRIVDEKGLSAEYIPEARRLMEKHGILEDARQVVVKYTAEALDKTLALPASQATEAIQWLILRLQERVR